MMRKGVVIGISVVAVIVMIVVTIVVIMAKDDKKPAADTSTGTDTSKVTGNDQEPTSDSCPAVGANVVAYCGGVFSNVTVAAGDEVMFVNNSTETIEPASDPHPNHTANTELNIGTLEPGERKSINPEKKGEWGIHDHLDPTHKGTITVE